MSSAVLRSVQGLPNKHGAGRCLLVLSGVILLSSFSAGTISARTPFMLDNSEPPTATVEAVPLELRGIVSTKSGYLFGIYDPKNRQSTWLGLDQSSDGLTVRSHDIASESITAEFQGRTFTMPLKTAKVDNLDGKAMPAVASVSQRALDDVRQEITNRRTLRLAKQEELLKQRAMKK